MVSLAGGIFGRLRSIQRVPALPCSRSGDWPPSMAHAFARKIASRSTTLRAIRAGWIPDPCTKCLAMRKRTMMSSQLPARSRAEAAHALHRHQPMQLSQVWYLCSIEQVLLAGWAEDAVVAGRAADGKSSRRSFGLLKFLIRLAFAEPAEAEFRR